jgi:hypothetical protein
MSDSDASSSVQGDKIGGDKIGGDKIGGDSAGRDINKPQNTFNIGNIQAGIANVGGAMTIDQPVDIDMGDTFSGGFQGAILNIGSHVEGASQRVGEFTGVDQATKDILLHLIAQLGMVLGQAPPDKAADAEKIARRVYVLIDEAGKPAPDRELVTFNTESLERAAERIAAVLPSARTIAKQIASHIEAFLLR